MSTDTTFTCPECETVIDRDSDDVAWSNVKEVEVCFGCCDTDYQYASTLHVIEDGSVTQVTVSDLNIHTDNGDDLSYALPNLYNQIERTWHSSDDFRGYNQTTIKGWTAVLDGWTTGGWDDYTARRKASFNNWAEDLLTDQVVAPCAVIIATEPTSNLFSTGITVYVKDEDVDTFKEWLGEDLDFLQSALH